MASQDTSNMHVARAVQTSLYRFSEHLSEARSLQILLALRTWWLAALERGAPPPAAASLLVSMHAVAVRRARFRLRVFQTAVLCVGCLRMRHYLACNFVRARSILVV